MGSILLAITSIVLTVGFIVLAIWLYDYVCGETAQVAGVIAMILAIIMAVISLFTCINCGLWVVAKSNLDAEITYNQERSAMYADMLTAYGDLRENDVTASDSYLNLYKEILRFNYCIDKADKHQDKWWAEGVLFDPTYVGVDPVPLRVME